MRISQRRYISSQPARERGRRESGGERQRGRTFDPGATEIFWCQTCNVPLLSGRCYTCGSSGKRIHLSPPADIRLCSRSGRELLKDLFFQNYGFSDFLDERILLLNKIAGIDRRDQVILDGHHIATMWFDITAGTYRLDLELAGAALLTNRATKNVVVCRESLLKGHIKGKWIDKEEIEKLPDELAEGDFVILRIGKYSGVGTVRKRAEGSTSIKVKEVTQEQFKLHERAPTLEEVIKANEAHLKRLEKEAIGELRDFISKTKLPVNVSFSGGKDSLASLCLALKVVPEADVLFIDTKLEFPETVTYVHSFAKDHNLSLHVIEGEGQFFVQVQDFGPPAKDFRWCCKTNKLGPLTAFIQQNYPNGCLTIEGRRVYESFSRSKIGAAEKNPYVPNQVTLSPIRNWRALEVMLYIYWNKLEPNPLYEKDYERIGCWLCPASLQSEFANTKKTHPQLHQQWTSCLQDWAKECNLDKRHIDWGFWRWRSHPPKILEIAKIHDINLKIASGKQKEIGLEVVKGRSPCGVNYSIEANLSVPQNHPFSAVANVLSMLGSVKYSESLGTAILETKDGRCTVFANGHLLVVAPKEKADDILKRVVETVLRVQMCTRCKICEKSCKRRAITIKETIAIDEKKCNRCKKCFQGCISAAEASKLFRTSRKRQIRSLRRTQMAKQSR
jgi:phosphoadenosine phosphosulfate reductase